MIFQRTVWKHNCENSSSGSPNGNGNLFENNTIIKDAAADDHNSASEETEDIMFELFLGH